jgi:hypothetical protein
MGLLVSTTGTDVVISELGIIISHPTLNRDMAAQFSSSEIKAAESLTTAITSGALVWRKLVGGSAQAPSDYDSDYSLIEEVSSGSGSPNDQSATKSFAADPSNITQNTTHRFVTDAQITTWNSGTGGGGGNIDGGAPDSVYGGTTAIDGGTP